MPCIGKYWIRDSELLEDIVIVVQRIPLSFEMLHQFMKIQRFFESVYIHDRDPEVASIEKSVRSDVPLADKAFYPFQIVYPYTEEWGGFGRL